MPEQDVPEGFVPPRLQCAQSALPDSLDFSFFLLAGGF